MSRHPRRPAVVRHPRAHLHPDQVPVERPRRRRHFRSYERVRTLLKGQALVGAVNSTDPLWREVAQWLWLRPTFIDAGGESLTL